MAESRRCTIGQQQQTHEWWNSCRSSFDLFCSQLVVQEASSGDPVAAQERLQILNDLPALAIGPAAIELAAKLIVELQLPPRAQADGLHVGIAAANGINYLLTWNCRHLSNAVFRPRIESVCRSAGFVPPVICTPPELMEDSP